MAIALDVLIGVLTLVGAVAFPLIIVGDFGHKMIEMAWLYAAEALVVSIGFFIQAIRSGPVEIAHTVWSCLEI